MEKIKTETPDIAAENVEKLLELFPEVATEVEGPDGEVRHTVDYDALRVILGGDVAENEEECYQFTWPGKRKALREARLSISKTLRPVKERSKNWDTTQNLYIEGDNLDALKILRETYAGQVKLIYIDPPYNTGNDRVYRDSWTQVAKDYARKSGEVDAEGGLLKTNRDSNGRFHSDWCSMMYPRLMLARDLLTDDGAIFISIDDGEAANLRKMCDELYGAGCFVADVSWQRNYSTRNDSKGVPAEVEHMLVYSKHSGWQPKKLPRTEEMNSKYGNPDGDVGLWRTDNAYAPGAATHQGMVYAIQHPITGELLYPSNGRCWSFGQDQMLAIMGEWAPYELRDIGDEERRAEICGVGSGDVRRGVKAIVLSQPLEESAAQARAVYEKGPWPRFFFTKGGKGGIARKTYLDKVGGRLVTNFWPHSEVGHTDEAKKELQSLFDGAAPFDTPKPVRLMRRILAIASDEDSLVLDFFSGSATMAHAVMEANAEDGGHRRFIMVQEPTEAASAGYATICEVGEERIRRAGEKVRKEVEEKNAQLELDQKPKEVPDIGFRVLKVDSTNFRDVSASPDETSQASLFESVDNVKDGRTDLDLLFEVLPTLRIFYSNRIREEEIGGKRCYVVDEPAMDERAEKGNELIACFDEDVGTETIEAIAKREPDYAVTRDLSLASDDAQSNFEELFRIWSLDTTRLVI